MLNKNNFFILGTLLMHASSAVCMDTQHVSSIKSLPLKHRINHPHRSSQSSNDNHGQDLPNITFNTPKKLTQDSVKLPYAELKGHSDLLNVVVPFKTKEGRQLLASGGYDNTIRIWDLSQDECPCICTLDASGVVWGICLAQSDEGIHIFWGSETGINNGYLCMTLLSFDGDVLKQSEKNKIKKFGPYKHAPYHIKQLHADKVVWNNNNLLWEYTISTENLEFIPGVSSNDYIHGLCVLDENNFAERALTASDEFYAQLDTSAFSETYRLFSPKKYCFDMFLANKNELITTTDNGFVVWDWHEKRKSRTVTTNLESGTFDNCDRYTENAIITFPSATLQSGFYIINYADGSMIQHITSDVLDDMYMVPNTLSITERFIIYTVMDCSPNRKNRDLQTTIYVSSKPIIMHC